MCFGRGEGKGVDRYRQLGCVNALQSIKSTVRGGHGKKKRVQSEVGMVKKRNPKLEKNFKPLRAKRARIKE